MVGVARKKSRRMPKKVGYTGLSTPPERQQQRGGYKAPQPSPRESVMQKNQPQQQQQGGLLGQAMAGKGAIDSIGGMYEDGKDLREGFNGLGKTYDKAADWVGNTWDGSPLGGATSGFSMPSFDMSMPDFLGGGGSATQAANIPLPTDFSSAGGSITSLGGDAVGLNSSFGGGEMSGLMEGSEGMGALADGGATTGLKTPGIGEALPYLSIGVDLLSGTDNLTGNQFGDAALRTGAAYATGGLSEIGYAVGDMFDWW